MSFHVPEEWRIRAGSHATTRADGCNGAFLMPSPEPGWELFVIASDGDGWEHVSVHARAIQRHGRIGVARRSRQRTPTWKEMCAVKNAFWDAEDDAIQFHPRASEYVNDHPHVLHIWRPVGLEILRPPTWMVGTRTEP